MCFHYLLVTLLYVDMWITGIKSVVFSGTQCFDLDYFPNLLKYVIIPYE